QRQLDLGGDRGRDDLGLWVLREVADRGGKLSGAGGDRVHAGDLDPARDLTAVEVRDEPTGGAEEGGRATGGAARGEGERGALRGCATRRAARRRPLRDRRTSPPRPPTPTRPAVPLPHPRGASNLLPSKREI